MNNYFRRYGVILGILAVFLSGCILPTSAQPTAAPSATPIPPTETPLPPTVTETPLPPTDTPTATSTPTEIPTDTPTSIPPSLSVNQNAVCRSGPGTNYNISGYLAPGAQPAVTGLAETEMIWWVIQLEDETVCWVAETVVTVAGDVATLPHMTPPPTATAEIVTIPQSESIYYFLTATDSGGPFGCETGDSLLMIYPGVRRTGELEVDITNALNALFSNHHQYYNGLYNPMYASSLRVTDVDAPKGQGEIEVWLVGDFARPKDRCDAQRMRDQVWETIEIQFPEVGHAVIRVHKALLGDLLVTGW